MTPDLLPPPVPAPDDTWVAARRHHLVTELGSPTRRRHPLAWVASGTGAVAAASVAALVVLAGPGAGPAFAGWTARPTTPTRAELTSAETSCGTAPGGDQQILEDTRGPYTLFLDAGGNSSHLCVTGPDGTMGMDSTNTAAPSAGQIRLFDSASTMGGQALGTGVGQAGAGVTGVVLSLADGTAVTATVSDGWFGAWWPSDTVVSSVAVATGSGTETCPMPSSPAGPPSTPGPSTAGSGSAGGGVIGGGPAPGSGGPAPAFGPGGGSGSASSGSAGGSVGSQHTSTRMSGGPGQADSGQGFVAMCPTS